MHKSSLILLAIMAMNTGTALGSYREVTLENNGYKGLVIAINPEVEENYTLVESIKEMWTEASHALWRATNNQTYFKSITILVPVNWSNNSYPSPTTENYDSADVLVADPHPCYGNKPYTLQYGQCGEPGQYIHLTPEYILKHQVATENYGPRGKTMVHEWAHLRWGVFDESASDGFDPFYYKNGKIEATRCPESLKGRNLLINSWDENQVDECFLNSKTGYPVDGCVFLVNETQDSNLTASLMSHQFVDQVATFCHDDPDDPVNRHNKDAPNEHNRLCDQRSVWDVITSSTDFESITANPANVDLTPTFELRRVQESRNFVLVLDTSGSMGSDNKLESMVTAAHLFITESVPDGSKVGIVEFNSYHNVVSQLTRLQSEEDRTDLAHHLLSLAASGSTCIYCGIDGALEVLQQDNSSGGAILLLTDGQGSTRQNSSDAVISNGYVLSTIFFGVSSGNADLQELSEASGGISSFDADLQAVLESFRSFAQTNDGDGYSKDFQIHSRSFLPSTAQANGTVLVDSSIGNNTRFQFFWSQYSLPDVTLRSPSGVQHCSDASLSCSAIVAQIDENFKSISFGIPGRAEIGTWSYSVTRSSYQGISVIVSSMASDPSMKPIIAEARISTATISDLSPLIVYARVSQGYSPVTGAKVEATITHPTLVTEKLLLFDGGAAPDVRENDGIYSRYFTNFTSLGRYSVQVIVSGNGSNNGSGMSGSPTSFNYGSVAADGTISLNTNRQEGCNLSISDTGAFERVESPGAVSIVGESPDPDNDSTPPSKIINLQAVQVNINNISEGIQLTFTSPGDDLDQGTAQRYEIRYAYNETNNLISSFSSQVLLREESIIEGNLSNPKPAGQLESFRVILHDWPITDIKISRVGFAVIAVDDESNSGKTSNVASLDVFLYPITQVESCETLDCSDTCDTVTGTCVCDRTCWKLSANNRTCIPEIETSCANNRVLISIPRCAVDGDVGLGDFSTEESVSSVCLPNVTSTHINFNVLPGECGSVVVETSNELKYEASVKMWIEDPRHDYSTSVITRGSWLVLQMECVREKYFNASQVFDPSEEIVTVAFEDGFAALGITFDIFTDINFTTPLQSDDYPVTFNLNQVIPFAITITTADNDVEVFTTTCVAVPDPNSAGLPEYTMMDEGCIVDPTMVTYPSTNPKTNRFSVDAFRFRDGLPGVDQDTNVIIQCTVVVCVIGDQGSTCSQQCVSNRRRRSMTQVTRKAEDFPDDNQRHGNHIQTNPIPLHKSGAIQIIPYSTEAESTESGGERNLASLFVVLCLKACVLAVIYNM